MNSATYVSDEREVKETFAIRNNTYSTSLIEASKYEGKNNGDFNEISGSGNNYTIKFGVTPDKNFLFFIPIKDDAVMLISDKDPGDSDYALINIERKISKSSTKVTITDKIGYGMTGDANNEDASLDLYKCEYEIELGQKIIVIADELLTARTGNGTGYTFETTNIYGKDYKNGTKAYKWQQKKSFINYYNVTSSENETVEFYNTYEFSGMTKEMKPIDE